jgi:hypothetical protein
MASSPSATYERLRHYIVERMCMSHVYQPLMLMELLGRRSPAPAQDVARRILGRAWWAGCSTAMASRRWRWPRQADRRRRTKRWRVLAEGQRGEATAAGGSI